MYTNGRLFYLSGELKVIFRWAKKIFSTMFDVCLPAMLFAIGVFYYCDKSVSFVAEPDFFHLSFFVLFGIWGFLVAFFIEILIVCTTKTFDEQHGYLWPIIPFNFNALKHFLIRYPLAKFEKKKDTF